MPRFRFPIALALILAAASAGAQPAQKDIGRALQLGREALELYTQKDWAAAFERFSAADAAAHSPVFVLYMARSKRSAGDLLASRDLYASVARETLPPGSPEPWQKAQGDAAAELGVLEAKIPAVIVTLRGAPPEGATATIDGAPVAAAALGTPIRLNPGSHTIEARAAGRRPAMETVRLAEGDAPRRVDLVLAEVAPAIPPAVTATAPPPRLPPAPAPQQKGSIVPGIVVIGVGAGGLVTGAITGAIAKGRANDILARCVSGHCLVSDKDAAKNATTLATVSTITFIAGGVAMAGGVVLLLVRPGGGSASAAIVPGPGSITIAGRF